MAKIEFTAVTPEGETVTRTTGTMPYVAYAGGTWHKTFASAHKAATDRYHAPGTKVVPVLPTAIIGKLGDWTPEVDGWGDIPASAFTELVANKRAGRKGQAALDKRVESAPVPSQADIEATLQAETVGTIANGVHTSEVIETGEVTVTEVDPALEAAVAEVVEAIEEVAVAVDKKATASTPVKVSAEPTIKLRITSRVSAFLVSVDRGDIEAAIIAKMAGARKRTDGSVTIATTAEERDMLVVHCTSMETANLEGAGFHNLDRLNKVNAARWLVARITEAEAAADVA